VAEISIRRDREPVCGSHSAQTKHPAAIPLAFHDAETCRTSSGRVDSQYAIWLSGHASEEQPQSLWHQAEVWLEVSIALG
jgi:hypothetical protein